MKDANRDKLLIAIGKALALEVARNRYDDSGRCQYCGTRRGEPHNFEFCAAAKSADELYDVLGRIDGEND